MCREIPSPGGGAQLTRPLQLRDGWYLSTNYIMKLRATLSPFQAWDGEEPPIARVDAGESGSYEVILGNFHEGFGFLSIDPDATVMLAYADVTSCSFETSAPDSFSIWIGGPCLGLRYRHVGDLRMPERRTTYAMSGDWEGEPVGFDDEVIFIGGKAYDFERDPRSLKLHALPVGVDRGDRKPAFTLTMVHSPQH